MTALIRKDFILSRALLWITGLVGIGLVALILSMPEVGLFTALLYQFILAHLLFNMVRQVHIAAKEDQLLISLPIGRGRIVQAKYAYCAIWAMGNALYLCLMLALAGLLGLEVPPSLLNLWVMLSGTALIYLSIMMPLSYLSPRYTSLLSMLIYLAVMFLPKKLAEWFGHTAEGQSLSEALYASLSKLGFWLMPMVLLVLLLMYFGSMKLSQRFYNRQDV